MSVRLSLFNIVCVRARPTLLRADGKTSTVRVFSRWVVLFYSNTNADALSQKEALLPTTYLVNTIRARSRQSRYSDLCSAVLCSFQQSIGLADD
ncbi:hypothetical protein BofuT4_uP137380.1 [Botrytis cinerea T4]|uniref:Uncharacterized protein n=1 Tax=Botryotinia fuckeliana (strain T4) TaxID=999810 RepID=G2YPZ5_BOTF4|nr:hypothetical protein BofuT4_uP137380.1 [Botrytis cinerea T4]